MILGVKGLSLRILQTFVWKRAKNVGVFIQPSDKSPKFTSSFSLQDTTLKLGLPVLSNSVKRFSLPGLDQFTAIKIYCNT